MIIKGEKLISKETGESFIFTQLAADTHGRLLELEMIAAPGGGAKAAPIHIHPVQEERFYIKQGVIDTIINGEAHRYKAGETIIIPAGTPHTWRNPSADEELIFKIEFEPALRWEDMFETLCSISRMGILDQDGKPPLLQMAVVLDHYSDHMLIAGVPAGLQKLMFRVLAVVGRLAGYKPYHPYFTEDDAATRTTQRAAASS